MKRGLVFFGILILLGIIFIEGVSALGPTFTRYSGCTDPTLNTGGKTCVQVNGCQDLIASNYYLLMNDVSSSGTCFNVNTNGVTLDLNNYTITYATASIPQFPNNDFEQGTTGWDFSGAPNAQVGTGQFLDGEVWSGSNSLHITTPTADQTVRSSTITLQPGSYNIGFLYFNYQNENCKGTPALEIVDAGSNTVLKRITAGCSNRGYHFSARDNDPITLASATNIYARMKLEGATGASAGFVTEDYLVVTATRVAGIYGSTRSNVTIKNGKIVQSNMNCRECNPIALSQSQYSVLSNLRVTFGGISAKNYGSYGVFPQDGDGDGMIMENSSFIHNNYYGFNPSNIVPFRDDVNKLVYLGVGSQRTIIRNNEFLGLLQGGVGVDLEAKNPFIVYGNYITGTSRYVNGFGIYVPTRDSRVYNNVINLSSGRGIAMGERLYNVSVYDNKVYVREAASPEPGYNGVVYGMQFECEPDCTSASNFSVYNNYIEARTHPDGTGAIGLRFTEPSGAGRIFNNTFVTMNDHPSLVQWYDGAFSFMPDGGGAGVGVVIENNTFISNNGHMIIGGADDFSFSNNTFVKSAGALPDFRTFFFGIGGNGVSTTERISFTDSKFEGGMSQYDLQFDNYNVGSGVVFNWTTHVKARSNVGTGLSGALVTIRDRSGNFLVQNQLTDPQGYFKRVLTEFYYLSSQGGSNPTRYTLSPYNISVTYGGVTKINSSVYVNKTLTGANEVVFTFDTGGNSPDVNSDGLYNVKDLAIVVFNQGRAPTGNYAHIDLNEDGAINWADVQIVVGMI